MYDTLFLIPTYRGDMETIINLLQDHFLLVILLGLFLSTGALHEWHRLVRPYFADRYKIQKLTEILIARYGDRADEVAFTEEDRAWRYSETFKQGIWRRVRIELRKQRRREEEENAPARHANCQKIKSK